LPKGSVSLIIPAPSADVFYLLHDYDRRIEWDSLLQAAYLIDGWTAAQHHARSVCKSRWYFGGVEMMTEYVSFKAPNVAAVKLINQPLLFHSFAATIRHSDRDDGTSRIEYKYNFVARPRWLRWLLHPIMDALFRYETKKRLNALRHVFAKRSRPLG
jgi:hypothetical protein